MDILAYSGRFGLALVLGLAGAAKLAHAADFRSAVANYRLLPPAAVRPVAAAVPPVEVAAAALLLAGVAVRFVAAAAAVMLVAFSLAVGINLARGRALDCGCFGAAAPRRLSWWTVGRNLVLVAVAALLVARPPTALGLWNPGTPAAASPAGDVVAAAGIAFAVVVGVFVASEALSVWRRLRTLPAGATSGRAR